MIVPQPVGNQLAALRGLAKFKTALQVGFEGYRQIVGFESMKGNIDLVQSGGGKQHILHPRQQGAVGGQNHLEAVAVGQLQKGSQAGMTQGFSHQMKVEVIRVGPELGQENAHIVFRHGPLRTGCSGTKGAF